MGLAKYFEGKLKGILIVKIYTLSVLKYLKHSDYTLFTRGVHCRISDRIRSDPKISDRGNCDPNQIRNFRISELFGSDHRVFGSDAGFLDRVRWNFWKIPIRIRSENPKFFPDTRSEISEILKSHRISEISDRIGGFSDRIFLHTLTIHTHYILLIVHKKKYSDVDLHRFT